MVATIITCFIFQKSANLSVAYGVAVASVMFMTTILLSITIHIVWRLPIIVAVIFLVVFGIVDLAFLFPTLLKFRSGGWFTLLLGLILTIIMLIWKWGTNLKFQHELNSKTSFETIFVTDDNSESDEKVRTSINEQSDELTIRYSSSSTELNVKSQTNVLQLADSKFHVSRLPGIGMFYNEAGFGVPLAFKHFVQHFPAVPQVLIFVSIRPLAIPYVGEDDRLVVKRVSDYHGCYRIIARYGYMEDVSQGEEFVTKMIEAIRKIDPDESLSESLTGKHITYVLNRQSIRPEPNSFLLKRILINFYIFLENISRQLYGNWDIPIEDVIDVGMKIAV